MIDISLDAKNAIARAYLLKKGNVSQLEQSLKNPDYEIFIRHEQFIIHEQGKIHCYNIDDSSIVRAFINKQHVSISLVVNVNDFRFWEEEGFIIDRPKYRVINEDVKDDNDIRVPMRYEGPVSTKSISDNHKLIKDHRKQIRRRQTNFNKDELHQLDRYFPGIAGAKKNQMYDTANKIKNMVGDGSNIDVNKIIASLK